MSKKLRVGTVLRYASGKDATQALRDGVPNFWHVTSTPDTRRAQLESGINAIAEVTGPDGIARRPAVLIRSSPHKVGTSATPWQDTFETDFGHIRYFGDNKHAGADPASAVGNRELLAQWTRHSSPEQQARLLSAPLLFFRTVRHRGKRKGYVEFNGYGVISAVELVTQVDGKSGSAFTNYAFDFTILDLRDEHEEFDWQWISDRRNPTLDVTSANKHAPKSWHFFLRHGFERLEQRRRRVSRLQTTAVAEQRPPEGSKAADALRQIYDYYSQPGMKSRFEAFAEEIASRVVGKAYRKGWLTPRSSDGGADFIGRLDVGSSFARAKLIVLGQAKCEKLDTATNGQHIARTVARLKRGWLGCYVTTSYYSLAVQREVIEDRYPLVLIHGRRLAEETLAAVVEGGHGSVLAFVQSIDVEYESRLRSRRAEEILLEE